MSDDMYRLLDRYAVRILLTFSAVAFGVGTLLRSWSARVDRAVTWGGVR